MYPHHPASYYNSCFQIRSSLCPPRQVCFPWFSWIFHSQQIPGHGCVTINCVLSDVNTVLWADKANMATLLYPGVKQIRTNLLRIIAPLYYNLYSAIHSIVNINIGIIEKQDLLKTDKKVAPAYRFDYVWVKFVWMYYVQNRIMYWGKIVNRLCIE